MKRLLLLCCATVSLVSTGFSQTPLDSVLQQMDAASKTFKNARADFEWKYYQRIVHDTSIQRGSIYFERTAGATNMGALISAPGEKVLQYRAGSLQMFDPGVNQVTVIDAGANKGEAESFLTLGFGGSGTDLARTWTITDQGNEVLNDGVRPTKVVKLDLVSKDPAARNTFTHVTIWVDPTRAVSLKQMFFTPSGDFRTATYSGIAVNTSIDKRKFDIRKNKSTTIIHH